ncbi:MAG: hypothetical protein WCP55_03560 [Lentisphaerota bacterium]
MKFNILLEKTILESILDIHSPDNPEYPSINDLIIQFYEITHKRSEILYSNKVKPDRIDARRDKIIEKLEGRLWSVINELKRRFAPVFAKWLESHALTNPRQWAESRMKSADEFEYEDSNMIIDSMVSEYNRYKFPKQYANAMQRSKMPSFGQMVSKEIVPRIAEFPAFQKAFKPSYDTEMQTAQDELENHGVEDTDIELSFIGYFDTYAEAETALKNFSLSDYVSYLEDTGTFSDPDLLENVLSKDNINDMVTELYEKVVFPLWYNAWKSKGIDKTRNNVSNVYHERIMKTTGDLGKEIENIGTIIQTAHQNGNLINDYLEEFGEANEEGEKEDIDRNLLQKLTDGTYEDIPNWDADIKEAGF